MACINKIAMNIIKAKCVGNKNLYWLGLSVDYDDYCSMHTEGELLTDVEYTSIRLWYARKSRVKKEINND